MVNMIGFLVVFCGVDAQVILGVRRGRTPSYIACLFSIVADVLGRGDLQSTFIRMDQLIT